MSARKKLYEITTIEGEVVEPSIQKAKELERDVKSITRILEEHDKHHWVQVVSPKTDDGQSKRFQNDLAEWLRQQKEIYEKELADL